MRKSHPVKLVINKEFLCKAVDIRLVAPPVSSATSRADGSDSFFVPSIPFRLSSSPTMLRNLLRTYNTFKAVLFLARFDSSAYRALSHARTHEPLIPGSTI